MENIYGEDSEGPSDSKHRSSIDEFVNFSRREKNMMFERMSAAEFEVILNKRLKLTREVLAKKRKEYANGGDRLHNFNIAASLQGITREKALMGMWTKHIVSIVDIVNGFERGEYPSEAMIEEKVGDAVNYLILLEAMMKADIPQHPLQAAFEKTYTPHCQVCLREGLTLDINGLCVTCHDNKPAEKEE